LLEEARWASTNPDKCIEKWNTTYQKAVRHDINEIKGANTIHDFIQAVGAKFEPTWAEAKKVKLVEYNNEIPDDFTLKSPKEQFRGKVSAAIIDPKISMAILDPVVIEDNTPQSVFTTLTTTINHISSLTLCDQDGESSGPCLEKVAESKFETAMFDKCFVVDNMHGTTVVE
ncbi:hypothetical protein E4U34_005880, partial [Claviceps purpurea]